MWMENPLPEEGEPSPLFQAVPVHPSSSTGSCLLINSPALEKCSLPPTPQPLQGLVLNQKIPTAIQQLLLEPALNTCPNYFLSCFSPHGFTFKIKMEVKIYSENLSCHVNYRLEAKFQSRFPEVSQSLEKLYIPCGGNCSECSKLRGPVLEQPP